MKRLSLFLAAAFLAACGGASQSTTVEALSASAPSYDAVAMDVTAADAVSPALSEAVTPASASELAGIQSAVTEDPCHPHLFVRTHDTARRVNRHLWHALRHVALAMKGNPVQVGESATWDTVGPTLERKFTVTRTGDTTYTWTLQLRKLADADFTTVTTGDVDRKDATRPGEGSGHVSIDLTKLASVTGQDVAGTLVFTFSSLAGTRTVVADAKDVIWDTDALSAVKAAPRSTHQVYLHEKGKGGSLLVDEDMVFACPSNPSLLPADVSLVSRWYRTAAGAVHGRSDALMVNGQLPAHTIDRVVGVTCHASPDEGSSDFAESYWLMKAEDAAGATIVGASHEVNGTDASACDPQFGPVPVLADGSKDLDFSKIDFTGSTPYPFPGM
ncbi:MAG: hypothetical protein QM704_23055 [Anaeromyxobacteraceae bacterium]